MHVDFGCQLYGVSSDTLVRLASGLSEQRVKKQVRLCRVVFQRMHDLLMGVAAMGQNYNYQLGRKSLNKILQSDARYFEKLDYYFYIQKGCLPTMPITLLLSFHHDFLAAQINMDMKQYFYHSPFPTLWRIHPQSPIYPVIAHLFQPSIK